MWCLKACFIARYTHETDAEGSTQLSSTQLNALFRVLASCRALGFRAWSGRSHRRALLLGCTRERTVLYSIQVLWNAIPFRMTQVPGGESRLVQIPRTLDPSTFFLLGSMTRASLGPIVAMTLILVRDLSTCNHRRRVPLGAYPVRVSRQQQNSASSTATKRSGIVFWTEMII